MGVDPLTAAAVGGLALSAFGTVKQMQAAKKSQAQQAKAIKLQQTADELRQARERRQQIREARIRIGSATQAAANQGASTSSSAIGGQGSIATQLSANLGFLDQLGNLNTSTTAANLAANKAKASADTYGSVAGFGATIFGAAGGFKTIFGDTPQAPLEFTTNNSGEVSPKILQGAYDYLKG